jgi:hypothetical protein
MLMSMKRNVHAGLLRSFKQLRRIKTQGDALGLWHLNFRNRQEVMMQVSIRRGPRECRVRA